MTKKKKGGKERRTSGLDLLLADGVLVRVARMTAENLRCQLDVNECVECRDTYGNVSKRSWLTATMRSLTVFTTPHEPKPAKQNSSTLLDCSNKVC